MYSKQKFFNTQGIGRMFTPTCKFYKKITMLILGVALLLLFLFFLYIRSLIKKEKNQEKRAKSNAAKTPTQVPRQRGKGKRD